MLKATWKRSKILQPKPLAEAFEDLLIRWIIAYQIAFIAVEAQYFRDLLSLVPTDGLIPSQPGCKRAVGFSDPLYQAHIYHQAFQAPVSTAQLPTSSSVIQVIWMSYEYDLPNVEEQLAQSVSSPGCRKVPWSKEHQSNIQIYGAPLVACVLPLTDVELSIAQFLQGLSILLQYLTNCALASSSAADVALAAAKSFALADGRLDGSQPSRHIGPLPALLYSQASALHHTSHGKSPMVRSLDKDRWTFILLHEAPCLLWTDRPCKGKFRYAFVRAQPGPGLPSVRRWIAPNALEIANVEQFLLDAVGSNPM